MDSGWAAILGALVGGMVTWISAWQIESRRDLRTARKFAIAAASEIEAALVMLRARRWRESVQELEKHALEGRVLQLSTFAPCGISGRRANWSSLPIR